ncbi:MAG: hypothetical protein RJB13_1545 [Pseudomonadota bacterium]
MLFDVFFSICQTPVNGVLPTEYDMFRHFFEQVEAADQLGYNVAWVAESHLSCEVQKDNPGAVIPNFKGEIGLNTDILLLAPHIFARTKNIAVGAAIKSILCNGGPIAQAEAVKSFLNLHQHGSAKHRKLHLGVAAGRFPFSSAPYGIVPRNEIELAAWPALKGKIFAEALEIFLKFLRGDVFSSEDIKPPVLTRESMRSYDDWQHLCRAAKVENASELTFDRRWSFARTGVIPREVSLDALNLYVGTHEPKLQDFANTFLPCGLMNLSITPGSEIEAANERMKQRFHPDGGKWTRALMPRTVLIFLDATEGLSAEAQSRRAHEKARSALQTYWLALEGTLDTGRIEKAVNNALVGNPDEVAAQIKQNYHPDDRLMLWFDFFNHDSAQVVSAMRNFQTRVVPLLN